VVSAIVAVAIIADTCEGFVFVAMPTPDGQLVFVFVFHILNLDNADAGTDTSCIPAWHNRTRLYRARLRVGVGEMQLVHRAGFPPHRREGYF
jgi:hypothetical protein